MTTCWGITNGSAGMEAQVEGLADACGFHLELKRCRRVPPFCWLPGWCYKGALKQLSKDSDALSPPWPDVLITSGRRSAAFAIAIKRASGGKTFTIHITDPRIDAKYFDLVVAMEHDPIEGTNVLKSLFSLHRITREKLQEARAHFLPLFAPLPAPRVSVLIGGTTNKYKFTSAAAADLVSKLNALKANTHCSILATTSRRTGAENIQLLKSKLSGAYVYTGAGENPYLGLLAHADYIVVTNDSVNMMSEAAFTGKPIYILPLAGHEGTKPARFAETLVQKGIARMFDGKLEHWSYARPTEREALAEKIKALIAQ